MGVTYDPATVERICDRLRRHVQDAFQKHLYTSAIFFADKLVSLGHCRQEDLYTLAVCYFKNREYRRVLHLLKENSGLVSGDDRLKLILAQSLLECKDFEECSQYLEGVSATAAGRDPKMASAFALLRGRVYEATENQKEALAWYEKAVELDGYCHEALDRLVGTHVLPLDKELALLEGLQLHPEDEWLRQLYAARLAAARSTPSTAAGGTLGAGAGAGEGDLQLATSWFGRGRRRRLRHAVDGEVPGTGEGFAALLPEALARNGDTLAAQASRFFYEGDYDSCYQVSKRVLEADPYHLSALPTHIASLVMLQKKSVVYFIAHNLVNAHPNSAVAWWAVGCYYYMGKKYAPARRFFNKALSLDHSFAPAWIAYGHAFALQQESDQAVAAYRRATRLFPGAHLPWLFVGMEYLRTNSLPLAQQCLTFARTLMPTDPHLYNELGAVAFQRKEFLEAVRLFRQALELTAEPQEVMCTNLGQAWLRIKKYPEAELAFRRAQELNARSSVALTGIGLVLQMTDRPHQAVDYYHRSLRIHREDPFVSEMLNLAVQEAADMLCSMELG